MTLKEERTPGAGVVIAAGGSGQRFGTPKQYLDLLGRPVLHWSLQAVCAPESIREIVVVVPAADLARARDIVGAWVPPRATVEVSVVAGGERRQESVMRGLEALDPASELALVHDAARPLVRSTDVERLLEAVAEIGAAVLGHRAEDSLKRTESGRIVEEVRRETVWAVQTPQGARRDLLLRAYREAGATECTDEATALRRAGVEVGLVEGPRDNLKITHPGDELLAEAILRARGEG